MCHTRLLAKVMKLLSCWMPRCRWSQPYFVSLPDQWIMEGVKTFTAPIQVSTSANTFMATLCAKPDLTNLSGVTGGWSMEKHQTGWGRHWVFLVDPQKTQSLKGLSLGTQKAWAIEKNAGICFHDRGVWFDSRKKKNRGTIKKPCSGAGDLRFLQWLQPKPKS